jgi:predicted ATPase
MAGLVLGTDQFPAELKTALIDKAEGVPLFVEEVAKTLLDLGVLRRENGGLRMVKGMGEVSVPETMQGIIMARLDRLGDDGNAATRPVINHSSSMTAGAHRAVRELEGSCRN